MTTHTPLPSLPTARTRVVIYHLEITDPAQLRPARRVPDPVEMRRAEVPSPEFNRFLYTAVGGDWHWRDRLTWSYRHWMLYLDRPELETWVAYQRGTPAGYVELEDQPGGDAEIVYFGLLPQFIGRGIGGYLLTQAIQRGWAMGAARVWVHTCSLDHPGALANYQARGLRIFKEEERWVLLPPQPSGPWPDADRPLHVDAPSQK
ncbi:MAG: GNAT family N-acetyltransferase [Caldilineaceae bacterium]|nr:GNAT family N-acetyltransferase [Caldilineaceae bacterium]